MRSTLPATLRAVLDFDVADYVLQTRAHGRDRLDPALRTRMAELYQDLAVVLATGADRLTDHEYRTARLAELALEAEWKLALPEGETPAQLAARRGRALDRRGKRYQPYGNIRLLNAVLGTSRHLSDSSVERRCWQTLDFTTSSWLAYERRTLAGTEAWATDRLPPEDLLQERAQRLESMLALTHGQAPALPPAAPRPPRRWEDYLPPRAHGNILDYLTVLPQTTQHDEVTFLRVIHLVETTTWGVLARVMSATEWLRTAHLAYAAECLERATALASVQTAALVTMRRTMPVENFTAFREATGDASAIQALPTQLLHIHLLGVHPEKVDALAEATENAHVLLYRNPDFQPLRAALHRVPGRDPEGRRVLDAARELDEELFRWRRIHFGVAMRYVPTETKGSGGTAGAPYLRSFYQDRLFDDGGALVPQSPSAMPPAPAFNPLVRARAAFSPAN